MSSRIHEPLDVTPPRTPGSVRRTSHIDMTAVGDRLRLTGEARDLRTTADGGAVVLGDATVEAHLDGERLLATINASPASPGVDTLVGSRVGPGFRAAVARAVPDQHRDATPLHLLLDDLPVAALISGYATLYTGRVSSESAGLLSENICAGWRSDGTMMISVRRGDGVPTPYGPETTTLEPSNDEWSWHPLDPLPNGSMRRRRLVEVAPGEAPAVWAYFRDTYCNDEGVETVVHEYVVEARVDLAKRTLSRCVATAKVLPWPECPEAAASAGRLVGVPLVELRGHVRSDLTGTSTCTHLNDLLRSLGDLDTLLDKL